MRGAWGVAILAAGVAVAENLHDAVDLGDNRLVLRHAGLEQLRHTGQTGCDLTTGDVDTTSVEGTQGELGTRFTN